MASERPATAAAAPRDWESLRFVRRRLTLLLGALGVVLVFGTPLVVMIATSLTDPSMVGSSLLPGEVHWDNYPEALDQLPLLTYLQNTLLLVAFNVGAVVVVCPLVAYSLAKLRWRGRQATLLGILATMMLPPQVTLVPVYLMWNEIGLVGTFWPLIIPYFFGVPFYIYLLRQFFLAIPTEYIEAARLDGASELRIVYRIVVPMAKPAVITVALFQFVATWTDFFGPLVYLNDERLFTLSMGLYAFFSEHGTQWAPLMAACTMFTLPAFLLFLVGQRYFVEGAQVGGIK